MIHLKGPVKDPWFPIVMMFTVVLAAWLGILGPLPSGVADWIDKWQNLIAAIIAIGAAALAYRNAVQQLSQSEQQEKNRRNRKHASVRAMLPLALSRINEYSQDSSFALNELISHCVEESLPHRSPKKNLPQPLPNETLQVLAEFIEYSDSVDASLVEVMVASIQIHDARVRGLVHDNDSPTGTTLVLRTNIENLIVDAASIYAAASALFDYARRRSSSAPPSITWENVRGAFGNLRLWDHEHPRLYEIVDRRQGFSGGPFDSLALGASS